MLKFTPEQELAVNACRAQFNDQMTRMGQAVTMIGNAAAVPLDAWRRVDGKAALIQRDVLTVFNKLAAASQTPVGVGDIVSFYPQISDSGEVNTSMDGRSESNADAANVKYSGTPVPVFDSYARMGWRQMEVIRKSPTALDTQTIANHQRKVAEKLEDVVLNGLSAISVGGNTIYGLRNFPERSTGTHGLTLATSTGAQWLTAVKQIIDLLVADKAFGKVTLFVNYGDYVSISINEFTSGYPKTILQRLKEIEQLADIVPASKCTANEIIGVNNLGMGDWGTILQAMPLVTRPKMRHNPEDDYVFGVLAMAAPQFRSDYDGRSQIAHTTAS